MQFTTWAEFINMGGYGGYVWTAYGLMLMGFVWNIVAAKRQHRHVIQSFANESQT